ncbi:MAG: DNA mismatch repair protein, partial [Halobacteria archaeon]|nr:DNA mismatch repair protein [Halobacteria archaeon]
MQLDDYWGVGPKTRDLLREELGDEAAAEAIENADVRRLTDAGLPRGRATRIVRHAKGGEGLDVLATRDARGVYKDVLERMVEFAVTEDAADRISVLTPFTRPEKAEERLDRVLEARESWKALDETERDELLGVFDTYDEAGGGRRAAVEAALGMKNRDFDDGVFSRFDGLDEETLEDALESLTYLDRTGSSVEVRQGADDELDRLRESLSAVRELEDGALDVVESLRESRNLRDTEELRDALVEHVVEEADLDYAVVTDATPDEAHDVTDFVTESLRSLSEEIEEEYEERENEVVDELRESIEDTEETVDEAVEAVDDLSLHISLARFSEEFDLTRPELVGETVAVVGARNLSLVASDSETDVQPVNYSVGENRVDDLPDDLISVLTGANSGGKTTLLETLCQVVLLAQMGLPVPADEAQVGTFDSVVFHRRHASFNAGVLESTLRSVVPPVTEGDRTLMLVDEFEAITEPGSAADLLHGLVNLTVER